MGITLQHQESHPVEVGVGLTTWGFEDKVIESGKTTEDENLGDCLQTNFDRLGLLDDVCKFFNIFFLGLIFLNGDTFFLLLKSLAEGGNLQLVNSWEERGRYKEDKAEETIGFKEMVPLEPGMEAGDHQGDDEDHQHGDQEVLLGWSGGQAGGLKVIATP